MPQSTERFASHVHFHACADIQWEAGSPQYNMGDPHLHVAHLDMLIDAGICSTLINGTYLSILQHAESAFASSWTLGKLQKKNVRTVVSNTIPPKATNIRYVPGRPKSRAALIPPVRFTSVTHFPGELSSRALGKHPESRWPIVLRSLWPAGALIHTHAPT
jgi:hypothetical protein